MPAPQIHLGPYGLARWVAVDHLALTPATVHVRDSKDRQGPRFAVSPAAWGDFLGLAAAS
ncbi:DUF397 domain-containing protein [Streptomyces sp. NPDC096152]|uniref:DUF397 domain-containing protein n=1 Tax=Streptomyces sp. NPDC096152 TaxID=3366078 RepID=UPI003826C89E